MLSGNSCQQPRMCVSPPPRGGVVGDLGMAPGGVFEGFLSSGFCFFAEACCSVIGTILSQPVHSTRLFQ